MNKNKNKLFFLAALGFLFCISSEYAITRPSSVSLFIKYFTSDFFPIVWICVVPLNFLVVYGYNYFLPKIGSLKTFFFIVFFIILINLLTSFYPSKLIFLQFMYKDIYILLMFKQIWSLIHISLDSKKSKYSYGILFAAGGVGGIFGGIISGFFTKYVGSNKLFLMTPFLYILVSFFYYMAYRNSEIDERVEFKENNKIFFSYQNSKYLILLLSLVVFMHISVTFIDYQFNHFLERNISDVDLRTQYLGRLISIVHFSTTFLQMLGGFILLRFFGLKKTHLFIPISLIINSLVFLVRPTFFAISYLFIYVKAIDFSIFSIVKEILFQPVSSDDKFRAKAIIDVFSCRTARAFASIFLLFIQFYEVNYLISYLLIFVLLFWMFSLKVLFKQRLIENI